MDHRFSRDSCLIGVILQCYIEFLFVAPFSVIPGVRVCVVGSYEQSEELEHWAEGVAPVQSAVADDRIRETLADAMLESPDKDAAATAAKKSRKRDL